MTLNLKRYLWLNCNYNHSLIPPFSLSFLSSWLINAFSEKEIEFLAQEIEKDITVVGVSAVEDKLQDDVKSTIQDILSAGIKLWVWNNFIVYPLIELAQKSKPSQ